MSQDEFVETPYAAPFGPMPSSYQPDRPKEEDQSSNGEPEPDQEQEPKPAPEPEAGANAATQQASTSSESVATPQSPSSGGDRRYGGGTRRSHVQSADKILMDESMTAGLAAIEQLASIDVADAKTWDSTVKAVATELRSIQMKWNVLEAERKRLVRPANIPVAQAYATRGVKRRGRGRGRRRGRWRGV